MWPAAVRLSRSVAIGGRETYRTRCSSFWCSSPLAGTPACNEKPEHAVEHPVLVGLSLSAAIALATPLGIVPALFLYSLLPRSLRSASLPAKRRRRLVGPP